ncbi:MAG TPA: hypothetical protein VFQ82_01720 [Stellaceae bacterium]|jgi:hypothetical protein|nr:hypothetical protein [Stellaceae bacterium]
MPGIDDPGAPASASGVDGHLSAGECSSHSAGCRPAQVPESEPPSEDVIDLGDERLRRGVNILHRAGPRPIYELLVDLGATRLRRTEIETAVARYAAAIGPLDLAEIGAGYLPSAAVELIELAQRDLGDAAAAGLTDEAAWHVDRARAGLDEMLAAIEGDGP